MSFLADVKGKRTWAWLAEEESIELLRALPLGR